MPSLSPSASCYSTPNFHLPLKCTNSCSASFSNDFADFDTAAICATMVYHILNAKTHAHTLTLFIDKLISTTTVPPVCSCAVARRNAKAATSAIAMVAVKYISELITRNPNCSATKGVEFRLFAIGMMIASKMYEDRVLDKKIWSGVTGIEVGELGVMEMEFLAGIDWKLFVDLDAWKSYVLAVTEFYTCGLYPTGSSLFHDNTTKVAKPKDRWSLSTNYSAKRVKQQYHDYSSQVSQDAYCEYSTTNTASSYEQNYYYAKR